MIRVAQRLLIVLSLLTAIVGLGTGPTCADEPKVVLFQDPTLPANRLHYPLLISEGRGYRIRCDTQAVEEAVIRSLGFTTVASEVLTSVDPPIVAAAPAANPLLCSSGATYPIKIFAHDSGAGPAYYLQFPTEFGATTFSDHLYIPGCAPLVSALKLDLTQALNADPTPFFVGKVHTIACLTGAPLVDAPTTFAKWCVKGDRTPAETATVMAVLDATPGGVSALGNPAACDTANAFLASITTLNLNGKGVQSLAPLSVLSQLTSLSIARNSITDLEPLTKLKALTFLDLSGNHVGNINALAPLTALVRLDLSDNGIGDIRALSALARLTSLTLDNNAITDLEPLQFLQALSTLSIANNGLTGDLLDPLSALGGLTSLDLANNKIETFANLGSFPSTVAIDLTGNPIVADGTQSFVDLCVLHRDAATPFGQTIRALIALGRGGTCTAVATALLATTALDLSSKIISDLQPLAALPQLTELNLSGNAITDLSPLSGLSHLGTLNLANNSITDIRPIAPLAGLINLDVSNNPIQVTDFLSACLMRNQTGALTPAKAAEVDALLSISGKSICGPAYNDLKFRQSADARNRSLTSIAYFPVMANLVSLDLSDNQLTDVSVLSTIPGLTQLQVRNNQIASIQAVLPLRRLEQLSIDGNPLPNLIGIGALNKLTKLHFSNTQVQSVMPLADLPLLQDARMRDLPLQYASFAEYCLVNRFDSIALGDTRSLMAALDSRMQADHVDSTDCSAAQNWSQSVTVLSLNMKSIVNVDPVMHFRSLRELSLFDNFVSNAAPIGLLTTLQTLNLAKNRLSGSVPRFGSGVKNLYLSDNQITNVVNLSTMPALSYADLQNNLVDDARSLGQLGTLSIADLRGNRIFMLGNVQPILGKIYLGNNPICTFFAMNRFFAMNPDVKKACDRVPLMISDLHLHVLSDVTLISPNSIRSSSATCAGPNCARVVVRPNITGVITNQRHLFRER